VDLKVVDDRAMVIEINDNPNLDAGCEDAVIRDELYLAIMRHFRARLDARGAPDASS
jgi:glutathione synthase/RimK-type ligase-like ATP-grasp enzyme